MNPISQITKSNMRTGTKFILFNWIITMIVVFFVAVVLPVLTIWFPIMTTVIEKLNPASIIIALIGQSGLSTVVQTVRVTLENVAEKKYNKIDTDISGSAPPSSGTAGGSAEEDVLTPASFHKKGVERSLLRE